MNSETSHRGAAQVGYIDELAPVEAGAVLYLRLWSDGSQSQSKVWNDFATAFGPENGREILKSFEALFDLCLRHGRRPLMRHHVTCKCLGADESCFANFVGYAAEGEAEDALLIATTIVRPDVAPAIVALAQEFGRALLRMSLQVSRHNQTPITIH